MAVSVIRTRPKIQRATQSIPTYKPKDKKPTPYQSNILHAVVEFLKSSRGQRRKDVFKTLEERWQLTPRMARHYAKGGVGSFTWMRRLGFYRVQVEASRITTKKYCYRYARVIEIRDVWH